MLYISLAFDFEPHLNAVLKRRKEKEKERRRDLTGKRASSARAHVAYLYWKRPLFSRSIDCNMTE